MTGLVTELHPCASAGQSQFAVRPKVVLDSPRQFATVADMPQRPAPVTWLTVVDGRTVGYQIDPELLEDFMLRAGITKSQLAKKTGMSKGYITDIVQGRRQPREDKVRLLADALDVHPRALLLRAVSAPQSAETRHGQVSA
jgi:ribosome-binding protein aMBF1 (putative translation factor)